MIRLFILLFFVLFFVLFFPLKSIAQQVPEIPNSNLNDIAMVSWHSGPLLQFGYTRYNGPVLIYNPTIVDQAGPSLTGFFYAHEYCHIQLNHIQRRYFESNAFNMNWVSQRLESEADSCATRNLAHQGNIHSIKAAVQWFYGQGYVPILASHPPGAARADNIVNAAVNMGVHF